MPTSPQAARGLGSRSAPGLAPDSSWAGRAANIGAQDTFIATNVLRLQAGGAADRMANGIDKIERNARPLRDAEGVAFV